MMPAMPCTAFFSPLACLISRAWQQARTLKQGLHLVLGIVFCVLAGALACLTPALAQEASPSAVSAAQESKPVADITCWWVSEGEIASLAVIQRHIEAQGLRWQQRTAPGSGTSRYWDVLKEWLAEGRPPLATQVIGFDIQDWASKGVLASLDDIAREEDWDEVVPHGIQRLSKYQGHWVAVPINAHSTNWLWTNAALLARLDQREPDTWEDLLSLLECARSAGVIPLAIGREAWEHTLLFECVAAGAGGAEFYRRAFLELDPAALDGPLIEKIFQRMSTLRRYVDPGFRQRTWDEATVLVREGKALLQVQGSWVLGEFRFHRLDPTSDYACLRFPDTQGMFLLNADQYMFFKDAPASPEVRAIFARTLMQIPFQAELSEATGAAPARVDVPRESFDACGKRSISDMRNANLRRTLMGSIAMGNANPAPVKQAIYAVVSDHFLGRLTDKEAAQSLHDIIARHAASTQASARSPL